MIHSLIHTSATKTLTGGSGFGVVAQTDNFPQRIIQIVSHNSGYQFSKKKISMELKFSTIIFAHWSIPIENGGQHVLTRISPCAADQSGRPNRISQHLIFDPEDMHRSGPASFARQFNWIHKWEGEPRLLAPVQTSSESHEYREEYPTEKLQIEKIKSAALGRANGIVLQLPGDKDPLGILASIEATTDAATRWAMYWTVNTQRKFTLPKHRFVISVASNPVESEILSLPLKQLQLDNQINKTEFSSKLQSPSPETPTRSRNNRYAPPAALEKEENKHLEENYPISMQVRLNEQNLETESVDVKNELINNNDARESKLPAMIALFISFFVACIFIYVLIQASDQPTEISTEPIQLEDSAP